MNKSWFVILFLITACQNHEPGCTDFKTGEFAYVTDHDTNLIERNDSIQTEMLGTDFKIILKKRIRWINDCEYELTFISGRRPDTLPDGRIVVYDAKDKVQRIKIINA